MEKVQETFVQSNYEAKDVTFTGTEALLKGGVLSVILVFIFGLSYRFLLSDKAVMLDISGIKFPILFIAICVVVTTVHELLHGLGWALASKKGWNVIKFNINAMMPSCSCKAILKKKQYLFGVLMPFIVLGIGSVCFLLIYPGTLSLLTMVVALGGTGGDLLIVFNILKENNDSFISDHPSKAGYIAYIK